MAGVNKVILVGNLGKDPEIRHLDNGRARTTFPLATSETYKNRDGERVTNTEWHNIVLWSPLAEIAEKYLEKGRQVYIEGKITNRSYDDKEGNTRYISEVVAREMTLLGGRNEASSEPMPATAPAQKPAPAAAPAQGASSAGEDDLPF